MKRLSLFLLASLLAIGCSTVPDAPLPAVPDYELVEIYGLQLRIDTLVGPQYSSGGQLLSAVLAEPFQFSNGFGSFEIPAGIELKYDAEAEVYYFDLQATVVPVNWETYSAKLWGYIVINEELGFSGRIAEDTAIVHNGQQIILLVNDNPSWIHGVEFNYDYYSKTYRDKIEHDIIVSHRLISYSELEQGFSTDHGYGMQFYNGTSFMVKVDASEAAVAIRRIQSTDEVSRALRTMQTGRPFITSYEHVVELPLSIQQFEDDNVPAELELIATRYDVANLERILRSGEDFYLVFRVGYFDDFEKFGIGILYFTYDENQFEELRTASFE